MERKGSISDAISNYYFHQQLPRTASLRTCHPVGKENVLIARNQNLHEKPIRNVANSRLPLQEFKNYSPTNVTYYSNFKTIPAHRPLEKSTFQSKVIPHASSLDRVSFKEKRCESVARHKKSVKFVEKAENISEAAQSILSNRSRSNSILKSRSMSKDPKNSMENGQIKYALSFDRLRDHKNLGIKQRYRQILNQLGRDVKLRVMSTHAQSSIPSNPAKHIHSKYIDPCFPPLQNSITPTTNYTSRITWRRISEMSSFSSALVRGRPDDNSSMAMKYHKQECYNLFMMLKLVKNTRLLDFMFEDLKYNEKGVYLIKIFQESQWKYIIVDDYVPTEENKGVVQLAFISIEGSSKKQIWPLLLQKAFAAYLGSYHKLHQLPLNLLFSDLLRLPTQTHTVNQNSINAIISMLSKQNDQDLMLYAERREASNSTNVYTIFKIKKQNQTIYLLQQNEDHSFRQIQIHEFIKQYKEITKINIPNFQTFSSIDATASNNIGKQIKNKYLINFNNSVEMGYEQFLSKMTVKSFNIQKMDLCTFTVKNYDKNSQRKVENDWSRVFLFQKELDSYRWIAGKYSKSIISFSSTLQPGKYYIILVPDRRQQANPHFIITSYGKHLPIAFHSENDLCISSIIQKGCSDLAQRTGKMTQINKWICTYALVHAEAGLIIENVNNQRRNGSIRIFRTIKNLKTKNCSLIPLNREFYLQNSTKLKEEAEIIIQKQDSASIILLFFGGYDSDFFKNFSFGL